MSVMAYNFSISLMTSSHTVVDPNNLLASTDSPPSVAVGRRGRRQPGRGASAPDSAAA